MAVFAFVVVSVCALLGAVEFALAVHTATVNNLPENVDSGQTGITFTLSITNDGGSTHNINTVKIEVDGEAGIIVTGADPPSIRL